MPPSPVCDREESVRKRDHEAPRSTKRRRVDGEESTEYKECDISDDAEHRPKRRQPDSPNQVMANAAHSLVIHGVTCNNSKFHDGHTSKSFYLDVPRLFKGDSKASTLRGAQPIADIDTYLEDNAFFSFVTYKMYSCNDYYEANGDRFEKLEMPENPMMDNHVRSYFFKLREDGVEATCSSEEVKIPNRLKSGMSDLTGMDQQQLSNLQNPENMKALSVQLYHYRNSLRKSTLELNESFGQHLEGILHDVFGSHYEEVDQLFTQGLVTKSSFPMLFPPGEIIVTLECDLPVAYILERCVDPGQPQLQLLCTSWKFDGRFYKEPKVLTVGWPFQDSCYPINELSVYPLRYAQPSLQERLIARGKKFWACRDAKLVTYKPSSRTSAIHLTDPRYMIDMVTYKELHDDGSQIAVRRDDLGEDAMKRNLPPSDEFLIMLPSTVYGFGFHDRKWRVLSVEDICLTIQWNTKAFDHLVIEQDHKTLIKAVLTTHTTKTQHADFVEGKGNGLIMLLHGGPGTGKTLTAESVAELAQKPLYRITCGDLGTNVKDVEKHLETVFNLGAAWGCVVLLDEADVFLEARAKTDLQRNALVSAFLRVLEYYDDHNGVLILTSNRVGTFDEAVKSRVQLSLHYPALDESSRRRIWRYFFQMLSKTHKNVKMDDLDANIDELARRKLNGREIRNAVKTAIQLAEFQNNEPLEYSHFEKVIKVSEKFEQYLYAIHGHSDSDWAQAEGTRVE